MAGKVKSALKKGAKKVEQATPSGIALGSVAKSLKDVQEFIAARKKKKSALKRRGK